MMEQVLTKPVSVQLILK